MTERSAMTTDDYMTVDEVAAMCRLSRRSIYNIPYLRDRVVYPLPRRPRWRRGDILLYLAQRQGMAAGKRRSA